MNFLVVAEGVKFRIPASGMRRDGDRVTTIVTPTQNVSGPDVHGTDIMSTYLTMLCN